MQATKQETSTLGRLQKRSDFLRSQGRAQKWVAKGMIVLTLPNDLDKRRFGITVTKKLEKSSVKRNRMKRRLRACVRDVLPACGKPGMDYILIARSETATRLYTDLKRDLKWCLENLAMLLRDLPKALLKSVIRVYAYAISPLTGAKCRFYPTCSAYAMQAIDRHGAAKGSAMAAKRLLRCHPWHHGPMIDLVPQTIDWRGIIGYNRKRCCGHPTIQELKEDIDAKS